MRIQRTSTFLFMSMALLMFTASCGVKETPTEASKPSATQEEKVVVDSIGSYVVYPTFADLAFNSDIIVIVRVKSTLDIVNLARDLDDHSKPDPNYFGIGQVYELELESYLKGEGPKTIYYVENQGFISTNGTPNTEDTKREKFESESKEYIPLRANQTYLLFLQVVDQGYRIGSYDAETLYVGTGHPWQFNLENTNCVRVEDILQEMSLYFPLQPLTQILEQIEYPVELEILPYPYPDANQDCMVTPYP